MSKLEELTQRVQVWAKNKGIYDNATAYTQLVKFGEEMLEYVFHKGSQAHVHEHFTRFTGFSDESVDGAIEDDIGDMLVCLINASYLDEADFVSVYETTEASESKGFKRDIERLLGYYSDSIEGYASGWSSIVCEIKDLIGMVKMLAAQDDIDPIEALEGAVETIEKRTGKMEGGFFVKDND